MDWRDNVVSLSDKVFQGLDHKFNENVGNKVTSNLPLQMALYFNVIFSPIWLCIMVLFLNEKYSTCFSELYKLILITITVAILIIEALRLYLGYEGNLKDKIPELAGFWMLSVFLQFPLQAFLLLNPNFRLDVMEIVAQSVVVILLATQIIFGYVALKHTAAQQAIYFRIMTAKQECCLSSRKDKYKVN